MRSTHSAEFETVEGPCEITIQVLDGNAGGLLGIRLAQMLGPGLAAAAVIDGVNKANIGAAIELLMAKITPEEFTRLRDQLLRGAQAKYRGEFCDVDGKFIGEAFRGHVGSLYKLVGFALKSNFSNFFSDLGIDATKLAATMASLTKKP
jgi:hypothetical protein